MEELAKLEAERGNPEYLLEQAGGHEHGQQEKVGKNRQASNEMCTFLILNISSLQLIPVNMIAYRSQYGSVNPTAIIAPAIVATLFSTIVAVIYCKMKDSLKGHAGYVTENGAGSAPGRGGGLRGGENHAFFNTSAGVVLSGKTGMLLNRKKGRGGKGR